MRSTIFRHPFKNRSADLCASMLLLHWSNGNSDFDGRAPILGLKTANYGRQQFLYFTLYKANFQRLTRLLMRGGLALLREVSDSIHSPANLPAVLSNLTIKSNLRTLRGRVLTHPEWNCLYNPSGPGTYGKSTDFDISLLCKLLRAICSLTPPATGWDILPNSTDQVYVSRRTK